MFVNTVFRFYRRSPHGLCGIVGKAIIFIKVASSQTEVVSNLEEGKAAKKNNFHNMVLRLIFMNGCD